MLLEARHVIWQHVQHDRMVRLWMNVDPLLEYRMNEYRLLEYR